MRACGLFLLMSPFAVADTQDSTFFERRIRPLLVKHCYECHSEAAKEQQGGLLLDRRSGRIKGRFPWQLLKNTLLYRRQPVRL